MNPLQWPDVERLFNSAMQLEPQDRTAYLEQACRGDESLRMEVERLMANDEEAQAFMGSRALSVAARALGKDQPGSADLTGGTFLHYHITGKIGAGGMGEVYRAEDTNIHRNVALKVLPEEFSGDAERLGRFQREAELLSSFNHPNIATLYGFEESDGKPLVSKMALESLILRNCSAI